MEPVAQSEVEAKGEEIFAIVDGRKVVPDALNPAVWYGRMMEWSMGNEALKVQTLRFVDVLPSLNSSGSVVEHMREYFSGQEGALAGPLKLGLGMSRLAPWLVGPTVKTGVGSMARQFITGRTGAEAVPVLKKIRARNVGFTVDILGEAVVSELEAEEYFGRYLELIESLAAEAQHWPHSEQLEGGTQGRAMPKVNVSVKISALYSQIHPADPEGAIEHLKRRLRPLFRRAQELGVFINLDMENYALKNLTLSLFESLLDEPEFGAYHDAGIVIQAYLRDSAADVERLLAWAQARSRRITIRLVKGAYWDYETVVARQRGWPIPVYLEKPQSDANYERLSRRMLEAHEHIYSAFGTHNVRSMAHAIVCAEKLGLDRHAYEIQMLYGMAEPIKKALVQLGHRIREYCPIGEMLPGMAYLVRRLLENTSNEGFLKAKFTSQVASKELLRDPLTLTDGLDAPEPVLLVTLAADSPDLLPPALVDGESGVNGVAHADGSSGANGADSANGENEPIMHKPFANEPTIDFTLEESRRKMRDALATERAAFGQEYPLVIGSERPTSGRWIESVNPSKPSEIVGRVVQATVEQAQSAVDAALAAGPGWRATPAGARADILDRMAALMREERFRLSALEVYEVGKPWVEADGDIAEAIDFCEFYAAEMRQLSRPQATFRVPGENSTQEYIPRGVGLVIAPWNFPLAILCGMTVAALVTGNTVIMKPAEQSSITAARFMDLAVRAGLPPGVLNFVTGLGEEVGEFLVNHPKVDFIAFTGSKEVGLRIWEAGGKTRQGQAQLKRVVCEMGGKNALIIDADADLDEAVLGALYSAFGYQGQKCSALSRLIVLEDCYDRLLERLVAATSNLRVGSPEEPATNVGPVIDREAFERIKRYVEIGKGEARLAFEGTAPAGDGYFIAPTILADVPPTARIAREEIFGPVLAVLKAKDLDEAIALANDTEFALTGGMYSRSPANIERIKRELNVGNLYINRTITGAIVARHPFGGFKMSGGGTKAGGRDYLLNFVFPRVVTENVLRRGFAPVEEGQEEHSLEAAGAGTGL
jgi:RHH-type proline utilization regulon transcriptional repressor/proline dehydrogenase/delta 1-pyrroline-5-carboxylate dehydrogenase